MITLENSFTRFADEVRKTLGLPPDQPVDICQRQLPDGVACALTCQDRQLTVLVDLQKPLVGGHMLQLLAEIKNLAGLLNPCNL